MKAREGIRRERIRLSAKTPITDNGNDARRSLGRYAVKYVQGGEIYVKSST